MDRAVEAFENDFARWDLHLPPDAVEARRAGQIRHAGWSVTFNFGQDAQGDYLDYYASPRDVVEDPPGDDLHVRLYASGERLVLPTVLEAYMYGRDPTWEELERARRPFAGQPLEDRAPEIVPAADDRDASEPRMPNPPPTRRNSGRVPGSSSRATDGPARRSAPTRVEATPPSPAVGSEPDDAGATPSSPDDIEPDASRPYLPIDIGLDIELNLAASARPTPPEREAPATVTSSRAQEAPEPEPATPERYYAPEETPSVPEMPVAALSTLPLLDVSAEPDDRPAPITLSSANDEPYTRLNDQNAAGAKPVDTSDTILRSAADEMMRPRKSGGRAADVERPVHRVAPVESTADNTADGAADPSVANGAADTSVANSGAHTSTDGRDRHDGADATHRDAGGEDSDRHDGDRPEDNAEDEKASRSVPTWESEFPEAAALTSPSRPRPKVFPRADLVLTADVATIDENFDSDAFLPWWHRPGARRIAAAVAAVIIIAIIALAATHRRSRSSANDGGDDSDTSASVAAPGPGSTSADTAGAPDPDTSARSQPGATASDRPIPSDSSQASVTSTAPETLPPPAPDIVDHGSDEGMARPAGPQSLRPIVPSGKPRAHATAVKSLSGTFPRGYSP
jgi:hypothetical protein